MDGMTPIERAARAVENAVFSPGLGMSVEIRGDNRAFYDIIVRAVLTEIREPSEAMVDHGFADMGVARCDVSAIYTAMIDAMLEEG